jgi:hypothetical protein
LSARNLNDPSNDLVKSPLPTNTLVAAARNLDDPPNNLAKSPLPTNTLIAAARNLDDPPNDLVKSPPPTNTLVMVTIVKLQRVALRVAIVPPKADTLPPHLLLHQFQLHLQEAAVSMDLHNQ